MFLITLIFNGKIGVTASPDSSFWVLKWEVCEQSSQFSVLIDSMSGNSEKQNYIVYLN